MLKKIFAFILLPWLLIGCDPYGNYQPVSIENQSQATINHVVLIWLKRPGNLRAQQIIVKETQRSSDFPGLLSVHIGRAVPSVSPVVDDSFDLAMTMRFINRTALEFYLQDPRRLESLHEKIMPLVGRIIVYDFFSQPQYSSSIEPGYPQRPAYPPQQPAYPQQQSPYPAPSPNTSRPSQRQPDFQYY